MIETNGEVEVTEPVSEPVETTETTETPTPAEAPVEGEGGEEQTPLEVAPAYTPSYGYKVYGQDKQFPEWVQPLIINKDAEETFRDIFSKADAVDHFKEKNEGISQQYEQLSHEVSEKYQPIVSELHNAAKAMQKGDMGRAFKILGIDEGAALKWAVDQANYRQMTPEEKYAYDAKINLARENEDLRSQNENLSVAQQNAAIEQRERELEYVLQRPEINSVMQQFDQSRGQIGAFRNEIKSYAAGMYRSSGQDVSAEEAVERLMSLMGHGRTPASQPGAPVTPQVVSRPSHPVIPNFKGGQASPVKKKVTSIDELRKYAESFQEA